jgi:hypothetical protein
VPKLMTIFVRRLVGHLVGHMWASSLINTCKRGYYTKLGSTGVLSES